MKKKKEPNVLVSTGIEGKQVYLKIDCPNDVTAGRYLCIVNAWLEELAAKYPTRTQIIED